MTITKTTPSVPTGTKRTKVYVVFVDEVPWTVWLNKADALYDAQVENSLRRHKAIRTESFYLEPTVKEGNDTRSIK